MANPKQPVIDTEDQAVQDEDLNPDLYDNTEMPSVGGLTMQNLMMLTGNQPQAQPEMVQPASQPQAATSLPQNAISGIPGITNYSPKALNYLAGRKAQLDLSPLAALIESQHGLKTGYKAPTSPEQLAEETVKAETMANKPLIQYQTALNKLAAMQAVAKAKAESKGSGKEGSVLKSVGQMLETNRGNPATQQAEKDLYAVQKAEGLANLYGDPNKLNPQQSNLYISEIAKIATGGVPTQSEMDALKSGSAKGRLAEIWQKVSNKPEPASAGEFIKAFQDYSKSLKQDAQNVINDKYGRVIETFKDDLGNKNYNKLQDQYVNRFNKGEPKKASTPQFAKDVLDYAEKHSITPEAANQIKIERTKGK